MPVLHEATGVNDYITFRVFEFNHDRHCDVIMLPFSSLLRVIYHGFATIGHDTNRNVVDCATAHSILCPLGETLSLSDGVVCVSIALQAGILTLIV